MQAYLWCELVHASDCMRSRCIQQGIARVVLQTGKCPQHIRQGLRVKLLQQNEELSHMTTGLMHYHGKRWHFPTCTSADVATTGAVFGTINAGTTAHSAFNDYGQWYKAGWPTHLEGMQGIISCNIQRGTTRVVAQSSVCPQNVAHVLWVVLTNALLQVISSSLQQDSIMIITHAMAAFCIRLDHG